MVWRLITWNTAGRVGGQSVQAEAIGKLRPDIVALQEVTQRTVGPWREALHEIGLEHRVDNLDQLPDGKRNGPRRYPRKLPAGQCVSGFVPIARRETDPGTSGSGIRDAS